ncbi:MAG: hypothetical protein ABIP90_10670, partial [Vicinamibacterales bacterium]
MNRLNVFLELLPTALAMLAISCGGTGDGPTSPTLAQTFNGTYTGRAIGAGALTNFLLSATVSSEVISGTLSNPEGGGQIPLTGTASASGGVVMTATDNCGAARYTLTGAITFDASGAAQIAGTWSQPTVLGCLG